ncbi:MULTISPECIES: glycosyltransferase [Prochlorococcus]|uniref:glycosyltransferase n=1 Tax=Prochlorococcus TaxID=1218 RepID=UPI0007B3B893|nr:MULTISPECIES: glycosyltransferase [Prochlorococcus]NMO83929.1 glycosyltransferase family 4 protein [Prochlorococcus sp. P1344]NMP05461.1 glycosyltransferase family 4 protein [Prochlorococcus sp. P1361]NMP13039.1 glycosyltransferase family 4 protein [Prochlorococcus sp.P1363]
MMLKIGFDDQIYRLRAQGGICRYFNELSIGFSASSTSKILPVIAKQSLASSRLRCRSEADIIHATFYNKKPYRLRSDQRLVSTLHDMTPERYPEQFILGKWRSAHANKKGWLDASDLIISNSESSADDLSFFWPNIKTTLKVIPLATRIGSQVTQPIANLENTSFWIFVGKSHDYKNGKILLKALSTLKKSNVIDEMLMIFVGGKAWSRDEKTLIYQNDLEQHVLKIYPNDAQLAWLYRHCSAVLVPSLAEGFSLPLIEALSCNAPLGVSDLEIHREVGAGYVELLSPLNANVWAEFLTAAWNKKAKQPSQRLGQAQYENLCKFYGSERFIKDHEHAYLNCLAS